jgi:hypothetical protein
MRYLILALLLAAAACSTPPGQDNVRRDALLAAVAGAEDGETVDLVSVFGPDWDRAVILGPYASSSHAEAKLGFPFNIEEASPYTYTEGGVVMLLAAGSTIVAWMPFAGSELSFGCPRPASAADSKLVVVREEGSTPSLDFAGC